MYSRQSSASRCMSFMWANNLQIFHSFLFHEVYKSFKTSIGPIGKTIFKENHLIQISAIVLYPYVSLRWAPQGTWRRGRPKDTQRSVALKRLKTSGMALWTKAETVTKDWEWWRKVDENVLEALNDRRCHSAIYTEIGNSWIAPWLEYLTQDWKIPSSNLSHDAPPCWYEILT